MQRHALRSLHAPAAPARPGQARPGESLSVPGMLAASPLLASAGACALDALAATCRPVRLREGECLFDLGDPVREVFVVGHGRLVFEYHHADGRMITLGVAGEGMVVGDMELFDPSPRFSRARILDGGTAVAIPAQTLLAFCDRHPDVYRRLLRIYSRRLQYCMRMLRYRDDEQLLAHILLDYARRFGRDTPAGREVGVSLSQEELATHVGTSRQRINRMLGEFRARGWIVTRYNTITLTDPQGMSERHAYDVPRAVRINGGR